MPLIVLDRDGVINEDSADYIRSPRTGALSRQYCRDCRPVPGGYTLAIATNQSGLGRGYFSLDDLAAIHARPRQLERNRRPNRRYLLLPPFTREG